MLKPFNSFAKAASHFLAGTRASARVLKIPQINFCMLCSVMFRYFVLDPRVHGRHVRGLATPCGSAHVPRAILGLTPKFLITEQVGQTLPVCR
jgi:hypothetical protein